MKNYRAIGIVLALGAFASAGWVATAYDSADETSTVRLEATRTTVPRPVFRPDQRPVFRPDQRPVFRPDQRPVFRPDQRPVLRPDRRPAVQDAPEPMANVAAPLPAK
jgi:hypothetical protein